MKNTDKNMNSRDNSDKEGSCDLMRRRRSTRKKFTVKKYIGSNYANENVNSNHDSDGINSNANTESDTNSDSEMLLDTNICKHVNKDSHQKIKENKRNEASYKSSSTKENNLTKVEADDETTDSDMESSEG